MKKSREWQAATGSFPSSLKALLPSLLLQDVLILFKSSINQNLLSNLSLLKGMEKVSKAKVDRAEYAQDATALEETSLVEFLVPGPGNRRNLPSFLPSQVHDHRRDT